jgi:hypothetical protein
MAAKKKAAKAGAAALAVKNSPYIQRIAEDEELRANLWQAYESARSAANRFSNGKSPTKAVFEDKKLQKDVREAAEALRDVSVALHEAPKRKRRGGIGKLLLLGARRRRPRTGAERGPAQEGARRAVRRRGGVRVQLHHDGVDAARHAGGHDDLTAAFAVP